MRSFRQLIEIILDLIYPPRCMGCSEIIPISNKDSFCDICREEWDQLKNELCFMCGQPIRECWCSMPGNEKGYVDDEYHLVNYDKRNNNATKKLIYFIKNNNDKRAFKSMANEFYCELLPRINSQEAVVASVPRSPKTKRWIGHDQSYMLAKEFCGLSQLEYVDVLYHIGNIKQKKLTPDERLKNAAKSYRIKNGTGPLLKGKDVILIDDVVTTGSTAVRCAHLLKMKGAARVYVFSIAKTIH